MSYNHESRIQRLYNAAGLLEMGCTSEDFIQMAERAERFEEDLDAKQSAERYRYYAKCIDEGRREEVLKELNDLVDHLNSPRVIEQIKSTVRLANEIAGLCGRNPKKSDLNFAEKFRI